MSAWPGEVAVRGRRIALDAPVYVVAEMACAHQGDAMLAEALVDTAADAGADAIQFELFDASANMVRHAPMYPIIEGLQFDATVWGRLFERARARGLAISAFVYDPPSLALANRLGPDLYKLNSSDLTYPAMLEGIAATDVPLTLGTGASTQEEIAAALACFRAAGGRDVILMHGVQAFPTPLVEANIGRVELLRRSFNTLVGYADHTAGDDDRTLLADLLAIGAGAVVVEKHVIGKRTPDGIDAQAALEPAQFAQLVARIRSLDGALGAREPLPIDATGRRYRRFQKKVAVARVGIKAGDILQPEMLDYLRHPDVGLSPMEARACLGRRVLHDVPVYDTVKATDLESAD